MKQRPAPRLVSALAFLCVVSTLLTSCNSSSPLLDKSKGSAYCALPTRWATVDKAYPPEVRLKEKTIEKIDAFWDDFKKSETTLSLALQNLHGESGKANSDILTSWMKDHLESIDPAIEYEFGPAPTKNGHKLDFSARGHDEVMQICKLLVSKAPKLPKWTFAAYRRPLPYGDIAGGFKGRTGRDPIAFEAAVNISLQNKVDVIFTSPEFGNDETDNVQACLILSDLAIGEENDDTWLGVITPKKGALMGQFNCAASAEGYAKAFDGAKKAIFASLPNEPYFKQADLGKWEELKFAKTRTVMKTPLAKLGDTLAAGGRFHNVQFSKCGEKFAYLKIPKAKEFATVDKLDPVKDELDKELKKAQVGCVFGTGVGTPDTAYIDLALVDLDKAVPILRTFCAAHKFAPETALRFYDCEWRHEWVAMAEKTTKPQDLRNPWYLESGSH